ncbi:mediator of RNA polymerase II transcription subunit 15a-like [Papaver somniferum]|uniref:mediator of RNA polymerase II transcription subunit 15a-like n=1 Tax=Papaver somniferum TaxID=3469 RepID=UPI000E6FF02F|nr:mediator of RNA polymerase II transcription subunit 15a-like [Papaver somniferum]
MRSRDTTSIAEQNEIKKKVNCMKQVYIPRLDEMLRRWGEVQQLPIHLENLKPDEIKEFCEYKTDLKTARSLLPKLQGHCWYMDDVIRWEKRLLGYMKLPILMEAVQLPGDLLSQLQIPQLKQHDSNQNNTLIEQTSVLTSLPKAGTLLKPANLPSYAPYSCTPLASSDLPGKPEYQQNVVLSSLPRDGNIGHTLVSSLLQQGHAIDNSTPVISDSPSNENCAYLECNQGDGTAAIINPGKSVSTITPIERLLKAVKTSSSKALSAAVNDIRSVVSTTDVFAGSYPGEEGGRSSFPEDLASTTRCRVQRRNLEEINDVVKKKLKRCFSIESSLNALPLDYNENTGCKKMNHALLEEVREINRVLINTKLGISDEGISLMSAAGENVEGTIVNCTFSPIYCSSTEKFPALPMWFLIPEKYPLCSLVLLDSLHVSLSGDCAYENLITEAWIKFYEFLRCMPEPTSLEEMAKSWDSCANAVFSEYARRMQK